jgi:hypothetical protein
MLNYTEYVVYLNTLVHVLLLYMTKNIYYAQILRTYDAILYIAKYILCPITLKHMFLYITQKILNLTTPIHMLI